MTGDGDLAPRCRPSAPTAVDEDSGAEPRKALLRRQEAVHGASLTRSARRRAARTSPSAGAGAPRRSRSWATRVPVRAATATSTRASPSTRPTRSSRCGSRRRRRRWASPRRGHVGRPRRPARPRRGHFAATIRALKAKLPQCSVEVLTPDFLGVEEEALATVLGARPEVFNHNIETVRRLHRRMRARRRATTARSGCCGGRRRSPTTR